MANCPYTNEESKRRKESPPNYVALSYRSYFSTL